MFPLKKIFKEIREKFYYQNIGAAQIIGIKNIVIKTHGSSDESGFMYAINLAIKLIENKVLEKIETIFPQIT